MTSLELKNYIIENDKIEYILESLGCRSIVYHSDKEYYSATQPDSEADNKMGVIIKKNDYLNYYSYSRNINVDEGKDIFSLIQESKNISFRDTMKYVHKLLGLKFTFKKEEKKDEIQKEKPLTIFESHSGKRRKVNVLDFNILSENVLDDFVPTIHIDLFREGITKRAIDRYKLCYSYKYRRTYFVHRHWMTGEILGVNGRTSIENAEDLGLDKYYLTPGMPKSINLYGLWENYDTIQKAGYVVVYESEKSVCKRSSLLDDTGVAISGHTLSEAQVDILISLGVDIIFSMDNDVDIQEIRHMCETKGAWRSRNVYYTFDKYDLLPPKSSIADAPNKVFEFIMKYKIKYNEYEHQQYEKGLKNKYK